MPTRVRVRPVWVVLVVLVAAGIIVAWTRLGVEPSRDPAARTAETSDEAQGPPAAPPVADPSALRVEVTGAQRLASGIVEVRLVLVNGDPARALPIGDRFADRPDEAGSLSGSFLTVEDGDARYFVLRDSRGVAASSGGLAALGPGERRDAWIRFGVPGPAPARMTLHLKGLPPVGGVVIPGAS